MTENMSTAASDIVGQLSGTADEYENDPNIEVAWAMKAIEYAHVHMNLMCSVDPRDLRLSQCDNDIHDSFKATFGEDFPLEFTPVEVLKSDEMKIKWRSFADSFKHVKDFNYGTLLRHNAAGGYDQENTIFVTRIQFLAIEIARNRSGINSKHRDKFEKVNLDE